MHADDPPPPGTLHHAHPPPPPPPRRYVLSFHVTHNDVVMGFIFPYQRTTLYKFHFTLSGGDDVLCSFDVTEVMVSYYSARTQR